MNLQPVHLNGFIYIAIAVFGTILTALSSDDAAKWIDPETLWFLRNGAAAVSAGFLALKMYRSTSYSEHLAEMTKNGREVVNGPNQTT